MVIIGHPTHSIPHGVAGALEHCAHCGDQVWISADSISYRVALEEETVVLCLPHAIVAASSGDVDAGIDELVAGRIVP